MNGSTAQPTVFTTTQSFVSGLNATEITDAESIQKQRHQELSCKTFTFVVYVVLFGLMVAFGLVGNTLSFIVLQFDRHSHAATFLLQVTLSIHGLARIYSLNQGGDRWHVAMAS